MDIFVTRYRDLRKALQLDAGDVVSVEQGREKREISKDLAHFIRILETKEKIPSKTCLLRWQLEQSCIKVSIFSFTDAEPFGGGIFCTNVNLTYIRYWKNSPQH